MLVGLMVSKKKSKEATTWRKGAVMGKSMWLLPRRCCLPILDVDGPHSGAPMAFPKAVHLCL